MKYQPAELSISHPKDELETQQSWGSPSTTFPHETLGLTLCLKVAVDSVSHVSCDFAASKFCAIVAIQDILWPFSVLGIEVPVSISLYLTHFPLSHDVHYLCTSHFSLSYMLAWAQSLLIFRHSPSEPAVQPETSLLLVIPISSPSPLPCP